jgi:hypothetical protein
MMYRANTPLILLTVFGLSWVPVIAEEALVLQLHHLKRAAEGLLNRDVSNAVLTTQAAFHRFRVRRQLSRELRSGSVTGADLSA